MGQQVSLNRCHSALGIRKAEPVIA